jgi:multidrug transporter EmrE-like cation transporter
VSLRDLVCGALIGLAAFGIEAGYLFAYRGGLKLASGSAVAGAVGTTALAILGVFVFKEQMTTSRAIGIALATTGAALVARA